MDFMKSTEFGGKLQNSEALRTLGFPLVENSAKIINFFRPLLIELHVQLFCEML